MAEHQGIIEAYSVHKPFKNHYIVHCKGHYKERKYNPSSEEYPIDLPTITLFSLKT